MFKNVTRFLAVSALLFLACACGGGGGSGEDGGATVTAARIDLTSDKYQIRTDGIDSATLTITARDKNLAGAGGVIIDLNTDAGLLSASQVTTDESGTAIVTFSSGPDRSNRIVTITASSGRLTKELPLTMQGTTLSLVSSKNSLLANAGDTAALTVTALDAAGLPQSNVSLILVSTLSNRLTAGSASGRSVTVVTNASGQATATLTALNTPGVDTIVATGVGAQASTEVNVSSTQFSFTAPAENSTIAVGATTTLTLTSTSDIGAPVANQAVSFYTTGGYFDAVINKTETVALTNANGQAHVTYTAGSTATPVDITATATGKNTALRLNVASFIPARLSLQASPSVIPPSIGGTTSMSTISAIVRDSNGQPVSNQIVMFTLIEGPGGGESLSSAIASTDSLGVATVSFTSGTTVSAQNGVKIRATLQANQAIYYDTTLTIAKGAASIVIGTTNKIAVVTNNGLEIGYALPVSVLVVDSNGNPVPNAVVDLGIYPVHFYTGSRDTSTTNYAAVYSAKFRNEDVNRNGFLDPGEDGAKGWSSPLALPGDATDLTWYNGAEGSLADVTSGTPNGRLDPGGVASIPASVSTDADGMAAFTIKYAKSYGNWIDIEVTASTRVFGDLSTAKYSTNLPVMENDEPYSNSPFGF